MKKFFLLAIVMLGFAAATFAQTGASTTASATATIVAPITITEILNMDFGLLAVNATLGTVELTPAASPVRTPAGGVTLITGGTITAAEFTVTGVAGYTYTITLPSTSTNILNGANFMWVDTWMDDKISHQGTLASGTDNFYVGGTLHVHASQAAGIYTSATPFTVTVNYN
ncbi:MAG: DUF4402 domain-containing protein [Bacteroidetes bacterium]|nr:DUF4402 domain-containing protein [Bacteroidota bacterium]